METVVNGDASTLKFQHLGNKIWYTKWQRFPDIGFIYISKEYRSTTGKGFPTPIIGFIYISKEYHSTTG